MTSPPRFAPNLAAADTAAGRALAYELLAQLWLRGLSDQTRPGALALDTLASGAEALSEEEAASSHERVLGYNVFPYEGVFLSPEVQIGGPHGAAIADLAARVGFSIDSRGSSPDHIGVELALLGHLCSAEASARNATEETQLHATLQDDQRELLTDHLLLWLPLLISAVVAEEDKLLSGMANLTQEIVNDHAHALACVPAVAPPGPKSAPDLLERPETGLKEIVDYLLTPCLSGLYLSRDGIARLGREQQLPRGFGQRHQLLHNLIKSAAGFERLPPLIEGLQAGVQRTRASLEPWPAGITAAWHSRLDHTEGLLRTLTAGCLDEETRLG